MLALKCIYMQYLYYMCGKGFSFFQLLEHVGKNILHGFQISVLSNLNVLTDKLLKTVAEVTVFNSVRVTDLKSYRKLGHGQIWAQVTTLAIMNVYKCLYKFDLGDKSVCMLDRRLMWYVGVLSFENKHFSGISCGLTTGLLSLNVWICLE